MLEVTHDKRLPKEAAHARGIIVGRGGENSREATAASANKHTLCSQKTGQIGPPCH